MLKRPDKGVKRDLIEVPEFIIDGMDKNASMWLNFPDMPFSKQDVVLAVTDKVIGAAYPMYFPPGKKNLFPLMVQMNKDFVEFSIAYYCFKLNTVFTVSEHLAPNDVIGNPVEPFSIIKAEMKAHAPS